MRWLALSLISLVLAGCNALTVGPAYRKPQVPLPETWLSQANSQTSTTVPNTSAWWLAFQDPTLNTLVSESPVSNRDLAIAKARILEARGARMAAMGNLFPAVDGTISNRKGNQGSNSGNQTSYLFEGGFDASWELDIFGGGRRALEAANATIEARKAEKNKVKISLVAEVIRTYLDYRRLQAQLYLTHSNLKAQQATLTIIKAQAEEGVADLLDSSRTEAQVAGTEATIPEIEAALVNVQGNLSVLTGLMPPSLTTIISPRYKLKPIQHNILAQLPASVIVSRPDVQEAERELAAATANQGVAMSNWLPKVNLLGLLGFQTTRNFGNIDTWSLGGTIRLPLLQFGRIRGLVQQANARQQIALATYEQTILNALAEVESTLTTYAKAQQRLFILQRAAKASQQAEQLSRIQFQEGLKSLLDVLVAQQNRLQAEIALASQEAQVGQAYAALHKALGQ